MQIETACQVFSREDFLSGLVKCRMLVVGEILHFSHIHFAVKFGASVVQIIRKAIFWQGNILACKLASVDPGFRYFASVLIKLRHGMWPKGRNSGSMGLAYTYLSFFGNLHSFLSWFPLISLYTVVCIAYGEIREF